MHTLTYVYIYIYIYIYWRYHSDGLFDSKYCKTRHNCLLGSYVLLQLVTTLSISVHAVPSLQLPPFDTRWSLALRKASACSRYPRSLISCKLKTIGTFQSARFLEVPHHGVRRWAFMDTKTPTVKHASAALQSYRYRQPIRSRPSPGISARTLGWGQWTSGPKAETSNLIVNWSDGSKLVPMCQWSHAICCISSAVLDYSTVLAMKSSIYWVLK